jgi:hypothetical protein
MGYLESLVVYPVAAFLAANALRFFFAVMLARRYKDLEARYVKAEKTAKARIDARRKSLWDGYVASDPVAEAEYNALDYEGWGLAPENTQLIEEWMPDELIAQYNDDTRSFHYLFHSGFIVILYGCLVLALLVVGAFWLAVAVFLAMLVSVCFLEDANINKRVGNGVRMFLLETFATSIMVPIAIVVSIVMGGAFSEPPPSYIAQHTQKVLYVNEAGEYSDTPTRVKLDGKITKSATAEINSQTFSWSEKTADGVKKYTDYYPSDERKEVRIVDDLNAGEEPYAVHQQVFDVLYSYRDGKESMCEYTPGSFPPCFHRNAWKKREHVTIHMPKGTYDEYVQTGEGSKTSTRGGLSEELKRVVHGLE